MGTRRPTRQQPAQRKPQGRPGSGIASTILIVSLLGAIAAESTDKSYLAGLYRLQVSCRTSERAEGARTSPYHPSRFRFTPCEALHGEVTVRAMPSIAASSALLMNGFARYAVAPCSLASLRTAAESCAVMMMTGVTKASRRN